jgi:hypothetical protein
MRETDDQPDRPLLGKDAPMRQTEGIDLARGTFDQAPAAGHVPKAVGRMESKKLCAYNQTRECFLGLEVAASDISFGNLKERMDTLALKSGEGLWLIPFRGLPETGSRTPLDLLYLDEDCRVIEVVESYPTFRVGALSPKPASVLALPTHSIYSSQSQAGDQLVLCAAEEMQQRLDRFANPVSSSQQRPPSPAGVLQGAVLLREKPLWSGGPGVLELEDRSRDDRPGSEKPHLMTVAQPGTKTFKAPKSWLERWWSPDPRRAPRDVSPGLAAYYWTGGAPKASDIRDISSSGLYVVTEERWYPGTLVLMTLQKTDSGEETAERTVCVHSRAVRWGNDGVGLQFVLPKSNEVQRGGDRLSHVADKKELDRFLQRLRAEK